MIVYLDFDGVLFDTVSIIKDLIKKNNIDLNSDCQLFFENLDWEYILKNSVEISDSINTVSELRKEYDVKILTHVSSKREQIKKKQFIEKNFKDIEVIFVSKRIKKNDHVNIENSILIDDSRKNVETWINAGGKAVLFDGRNLKNLVEECLYV